MGGKKGTGKGGVKPPDASQTEMGPPGASKDEITTLRSLIDQSPDGIFVADLEGKFLLVNQAMVHELGYSRQELLEKSIWDIVPGKYRRQFRNRIRKIMVGRELDAPAVYEVKARNGKRVVEILSAPHRRNGEIVGFQGIARDVTERYRIEKQIRDSEERLRILFEEAPDAIYINDLKGILLDGNRMAEELIGRKREDLRGESFFNLKVLPPDQIPKATSLLAQNALGKATGPDEFTLIHPDNRTIDVEIRTYPVKLSNRKVVLAVARDITGRRQRDERIRKLSSAVEQSTVSIVLTDLQGNIEYVNPEFTRMTGYTADEVLGENPRILKSGETPAGEYERLWKRITGGTEWQGEFHNKKKNGELYWELANISPIRDEAGKITHFLGVKEDITERKKAAHQIEASLRDKEILLRELYHRTKNNMQVICSLIGLQEQRLTNASLKSVLRELDGKIRSMALVHGKLYESGDLAHINLKNYIKELTALLLRSFNVSPGRIAFVMNMKDLLVNIDAAVPCGLILNELITNALKHAFPDNRPGSIRIDLKRNRQKEIVIRVTDDGVGLSGGIDLENLETLGLSTVRSIVSHQLDGQIQCTGPPGFSCEIRFQDNK